MYLHSHMPKIRTCHVLGKQQGDRETRGGDEVKAGMTAGCSKIYSKVRGSPILMVSYMASGPSGTSLVLNHCLKTGIHLSITSQHFHPLCSVHRSGKKFTWALIASYNSCSKSSSLALTSGLSTVVLVLASGDGEESQPQQLRQAC